MSEPSQLHQEVGKEHPGALRKNMEMAILLLSYLEDNPSEADKLFGCIVCQTVENDKDLNEYNRRIAQQISFAENKPIAEVHWDASMGSPFIRSHVS